MLDGRDRVFLSSSYRAFGRRLKAQEPRDDFPDDYEV